MSADTLNYNAVTCHVLNNYLYKFIEKKKKEAEYVEISILLLGCTFRIVTGLMPDLKALINLSQP